jgi:hypothetical protein
MIITMTWADGVLALLLGVVGSMLAAYFYTRVPKLLSVVAVKWAERSDRAARKRLERLQIRFDEIEELQHDITRYVGWISFALADLVFKLALSIILSVLAAATGVLIELKTFSGFYEFVPYVFVGLFAGSFLLSAVSVVKITDRQDMNTESANLKHEIDRIKLRLNKSEK